MRLLQLQLEVMHRKSHTDDGVKRCLECAGLDFLKLELALRFMVMVRVGVRLILGHISYISAHYFYFQHFRCLFILSTVPCTVIVNSYYTFDVQERTVKNGAVCQ